MPLGTKPETFFKAGMYLLDSFTSGMYNDPLTIYREYIQNAVDSIDMIRPPNAKALEVRIELEPNTRRITILDNALGIPSSTAEEVLSTIGNSNKSESQLRGFRGIGRLGGIAFSDKAVFRTKATKDTSVSIQEWDCESLRDLLSEQRKHSFTLEEVFKRVTTFRQEMSTEISESYFEVTLEGVTSFRNQLFDIQRVRRYLAQIAPVPLNPQEFSYASLIDEHLSSHLSHYGKYNLILNGERIFKPYRDRVKVTKKGEADFINGIEFFEIKNGNRRPMAFGWYGKRKELLGSITRGDDSAGIRVRVGNIQIGDAHLLDFCFREPRFNSYVPGEIYVECADLIPNSRRDDFVDNLTKGSFYNAIEREVGIPVSKEIRLRSRLASIPEYPKTQIGSESSGHNSKAEVVSPSAKKAKQSPCQDFKEVKKSDANDILPLGVERIEVIGLGSSAKEIVKSCCNGCPNLVKLLAALKPEAN